MKNYNHFKLEDFILDDEFRKSVSSPTESSERFWAKFIEDAPEKKEVIEEAKQIVLALEPVEEEVSAYRLNNLWHRINQSGQPKLIGIPNQVLKYAAVFVLAFILTSLGFFLTNQPSVDLSQTYTEINVPYGEKSEVILYDGTRVWLNSGTKLKFPIVFNSNKRNVYIEGEAFFDVAKNKDKPFLVNAGELTVKVLGTRFNICAYPEDTEYHATLEEGKILASNNSTENDIELKPGEQLSLHRQSKNMKVKQVKTELYTSWKENILRFEDAAFFDVIKKMERWYDVSINVKEIGSFKKQYNMTIKTESLREMLQLISFTTPINYEINEEKVFISRK